MKITALEFVKLVPGPLSCYLGLLDSWRSSHWWQSHFLQHRAWNRGLE